MEADQAASKEGICFKQEWNENNDL